MTDEGNSRKEIWHWKNDEIGVAIQSWFWVGVEFMAWQFSQLERLNGIYWSWVDIPLRPTFYSYFKESFSGKYHIYANIYIYYIRKWNSCCESELKIFRLVISKVFMIWTPCRKLQLSRSKLDNKTVLRKKEFRGIYEILISDEPKVVDTCPPVLSTSTFISENTIL